MMAVPAAQAADAQTPEDARLANLFQSYLDQEFQRHPAVRDAAGQPRVRRPARRPLPGGSPEGRRKCPRDARHARQGDRFQKALAERPDRPRNLVARLEVRVVVGRERQPLRVRPARLRRIHLGQRVHPVHAIDAAARAERAERREAHHLHPEDRRGGEGEPEEPAEDSHRDRDQAQPRRDQLLREGDLRVREGDAGQRTARDAVQGSREGAQGLPDSGSKRNFCPSRTASGGSGRRSSPRSWNSNSTPASRRTRW